MSEERKGAMTPEQEEILDKVLQFQNKMLEAADGPAISLVDNQGIERLLDESEKKWPGSREVVHQVVDMLFVPLSEMANEIDKED